jgi:hypothetical protein
MSCDPNRPPSSALDLQPWSAGLVFSLVITCYIPIPVELDSVGGLALDDIFGVEKGTEHLHGGDGTATVIIGAGSGEDGRQEEVDGVLMRANDDSLVGLARNSRDDGVLLPSMGEALSRDSILSTSVLDDAVDLLKDPVGGLEAIFGLVVSGMEARQLLEVCLHVVLVELLRKRSDLVLLDALLGEGNGGSSLGAGTESAGVGDVHEALAILRGNEC